MKRSVGFTHVKIGILAVLFSLFLMKVENSPWVFFFCGGVISVIAGIGVMIFGNGKVIAGRSSKGAEWLSAGAAGMAGTAAAYSMDTGPTVNVDGTPMVHGTNIDIHGNPYGVTSPSFNIDGTPMHAGGMTDFNGNAYGHTSDHSFSSSSDPFKHD